ncbi:sll0812 [Synechocystis sp. PCC 6803]|uniref:Sll0812 protein n=1 Tax=Synechocystis sp. (strain ATCC 27184 / PCC 6803 / Kazusa) TaxID=1111708 RepID=P74047_SYNY3|nr:MULTISPECIES: hypothetical protein [unclassified Synechocystis]AGF51810.1 hypothetical protein MYO_115600 [Synechocystis sp. PCC 6803]ALJ67790.1 hypothetical protein AOY38_08015 [Synechocystis sp. PCC 6803]AVP89622.1 hypothetical protein C7I86_08030 [Synechocystis sp. IPPAS B-1465]MBD2618758.1 hypothetical protein [Synechocystis sp. FACHB-898]MBD2640259.1 hypothetical protein [Synechocystis sp. FACHB-908]
MGSPEFSPNVTSLTTKPPKRSRHRKRPKRRPIHCPIHGCYLDSVSQKHGLYADQIAQLRSRGYTHKKASLVLGDRPTVSLTGEWLEEFWCPECQSKRWYYVRKQDSIYMVTPAPRSLWETATGVTDPKGNPSVSQYTKTNANQHRLKSSRFNF